MVRVTTCCSISQRRGLRWPACQARSSAPRSWTNLHRIVGLVYVLIYIVLMWQMLPRLWEYQVELPARTVIHAQRAADDLQRGMLRYARRFARSG